MDRSVLENQIEEMASALAGTEEDLEAHFAERNSQFSDGEKGWMEFNMRFAPSERMILSEERNEEEHLVSRSFSLNGPQDPRIIVPDEGDATIAYQEEDGSGVSWIEEKLDPDQQQILNQYARRARKILQDILDNMQEEEDEDWITEEEYERDLAEDELNPEKNSKFKELLRRTIVMGRSATGDLKLMEELAPGNEEVSENRAAMETAFHCLLAAAIITDTEWEPL